LLDAYAKYESAERPGTKTVPLAQRIFSYLDALVVCREKRFHDQYRDVLLNPTVIIEVLSKSTEAFDRGDKFLRYRTWLPTFTDYVLVAQTSPIIEHYRRQRDEEWILATVEGLDKSLSISSINCTLVLREIYDGVLFLADTPTLEDDLGDDLGPETKD
jgi:Uma2 family endonuclease